jgi:hypothetical protein
MLNERYAKEPGGIEKVTRYVNAYFKVHFSFSPLGLTHLQSMISKMQEHGGDVLKFAGDALIVAFGSTKREESLATCVLRATQCALGKVCFVVILRKYFHFTILDSICLSFLSYTNRE